ncbi:Septum site-determining protein MinC (MinC) (PDB:1HF2) [Commensalibacter communis]|uniref:septum site-determining protein MinC n=1 Tax=Commensalibacter communis TaxID=2972786 RepID=UPI0022FF6109|nr:septum site-determining protein MinC [Commensalibacter communis]CAI3927394.1 Septum site-determining protein MinC (MinC) (PDB:1HF2) [Commensalibacter communis]CAI3931939.1 Septum site-determining protein MinC (MinC) (PDB:1HF2) [Commensalibacter communis]
MPDTSPSLPQIRIRGRSFLSLVLSPEAPLPSWLASLDKQLERSSFFFLGKPVILNLELLSGQEEGLENLHLALSQRNIQIISVEGGSSTWEKLKSWPKTFIFGNGKNIDNLDMPANPQTANIALPCLIIDEQVRSGQSVLFPEGDVIITNSVASGTEIVAGGSIHVYGALRGRAIAGISGQPKARIFAYQLEAELMAIDGYYMTAEEIDNDFSMKAAQVYLDKDVMTVAPLLKIK